MKKTKLLLVFTVLLCMLGLQNAKAQVTGVTISSGSKIDAISHPCVPSDLSYYSVSGTVAGTVPSLDSVTIKFYYGDGTFAVYKQRIDSGRYFSVYKSLPKTYTTAGTYTTKVVVTASTGVADSMSSSPFTLSSGCSITGITINKTASKIDSLIGGSCTAKTLPYRVTGTIAGSFGKTDSFTVKFDYGDGTVVSYKTPITGSPFNLFKPSSHSYSIAGTYSTKIVITAPSGVADSMTSAPFTISTSSSGITATKLYAYGILDSFFALCRLPFPYAFQANGTITGCTTTTDTALVNFNFGDGTDTTLKAIIPAGSSAYYTSRENHIYTIAGTYTPRVIVTIKSSGVKDTVYLPSFTLSDSCATIKGNLYVDDNGNCIKNTGESGVWYIPIRIINTSTGITSWAYKWSDIDGNYSIDLPAGSYNITPMVNTRYSSVWSYAGDTLKPTCPSSGTTTLTVAAMTSYTRDFAYSCTPVTSFDAQALVSSNCYVPGDTAVMKVWAGDWWRVYYYNCLSLSTTLTLTLDAKLTYAGHLDGKAPASIVGKVITWNLSGSDLALFSSRIKTAVATTASAGDTLRSTAYIAPATGVTDPNLSNNTHNYARVVVSSFDPNNKESAPNGKGKQGYIAKNTPMTYTINFQNTGTAPARNITIVDSLESDLDASSFHMISSTHNAVVYKEANVLKFRFNDIYLPDSGSNYYGSMGSVTFGILPVRDLAPGTEIKNRAGIYFDYNAPIITNYALNTIEIPTNIQNVVLGNWVAKVFPNPAHTELNINTESKGRIMVSMMDMLGRTVATEQSQNGNISIATQHLAEGMYLLNISDTEGNQQNTKVMVKH